MTGVKGQLVPPPEGARKVPGMKTWTTEDGKVYGMTGELSNRACRREKAHYTTATMDEPQGRKTRRTMSIAQMMALTWLPPKPPNSKLVHLDGNLENNAASNLAWRPVDTERQAHEKYYAKAMVEMEDPNDPRHGTKTGYTIGCRCELCTRAVRVAKAMTATRKTIREVERLCGTRA